MKKTQIKKIGTSNSISFLDRNEDVYQCPFCKRQIIGKADIQAHIAKTHGLSKLEEVMTK